MREGGVPEIVSPSGTIAVHLKIIFGGQISRFVVEADYQKHLATADVALLQLEQPATGKSPALLGMPNIPIEVGGRFTIAGIGVTVPGDGKSAGTVRVIELVATGRPGTLQIRLVDTVSQGTRAGLGALAATLNFFPIIGPVATFVVLTAVGVMSFSTLSAGLMAPLER